MPLKLLKLVYISTHIDKQKKYRPLPLMEHGNDWTNRKEEKDITLVVIRA